MVLFAHESSFDSWKHNPLLVVIRYILALFHVHNLNNAPYISTDGLKDVRNVTDRS